MRRIAILATLMLGLAVMAGEPSRALAAEEAASLPPKVEELVKLLADPAVQQWLEAQRVKPTPPPERRALDPAAFLAERLAVVRDHLADLAASPGRLPSELRQAWQTLRTAAGERGPLTVLALGALCIALGFAARWLYGRAAGGWPDGEGEAVAATARERLRMFGRRLLYGAGGIVAYAAGSIGSFLLIAWPPLVHALVLAVILAILCLLAVRLVLMVLLRPSGAGAPSPLRILPMDDGTAAFWTRRLTAAAAVFAFGWALARVLRTLGVSLEDGRSLVYLVGIVLLGLGLDAVWRGPQASAAEAPERGTGRWALSLYFLLVWALWVVGAMNLFWLIVVAGLLAGAIPLCRRAVAHVFPAEAEAEGPAVPSMTAAILERGLRAALIVGALLILAWGWDIDIAHLAAQDTLFTRLIRGAISAIVILLVADVLWQVLKTVIDLQIARARIDGGAATEEVQRRTRLRTLLPIVRNVLFVTIAVVAVLMALAALGVEIGPLVAGAGILGVAIGFGAQTLVKDIISGMFYLLDDAFRVGEYIESGSFKGTVESFSLRSVKLRHHRGPVFTVPFGELGAIQNMSRDWVVDKLLIGITYDSDIEKARKIIKKIGLELAEDPEFKPDVIEPLKMQGVEAFGDFAVQLRLKMKTKPGGQFVMRRRALAMIKEAFDENGIKFAFPTVTIAGKGEEADVAAAQEALARQAAAGVGGAAG
jgi:small-conductance mechanosensitive channel